VIARPFVGKNSADFRRTAHRRDYTMPPPARTILSLADADGRAVISIGKIADIFAHQSTGHSLKVESNADAFDRVVESAAGLPDGGFAFANLNDFDTLFGHRRDVAGYAAALEAFDARLPELLGRLRRDDLVIVTADHGCDPTWRGTDHTREFIPIVAFGPQIPRGSAGRRSTFSDIGATVAAHLCLPQVAARPLWH